VDLEYVTNFYSKISSQFEGLFPNYKVPSQSYGHDCSTLTHSFIRLLAEKKYLHTCFTQNIDTLERRAGVPADKIIEAHGSFATQHCIHCKADYPDDEIKERIAKQELPTCKKCKGYVKLDIVFFGEGVSILDLTLYDGKRELI